MSHADFVHLHLHTEYSLLDGACRLDRLMERAHELKFPALTITDHGVMYGAIDFYQAARNKGIKPIIGCEMYVAPGSRLEKKSGNAGRDVYHHLVLLAKDEVGYSNLTKLATAAHLEGFYYKPRIDKEILARHREGLIALSGCIASEIPDWILKDQPAKARDAVDWFKQTFGAENFYLELQNHTLAEQAKVNRQLLAWAKDFGLSLVATNDVHYVERGHSHAHDCLICIGTQSQLNDPKRMRYVPEQFYLRSAEEMKALFSEVPDAVRNTLEVAEKCNVEIKFPKATHELHYPVFHPPEHFTREGYLRHLIAEGLYHRYTIRAKAAGSEFVVEGIDDPGRLPTYVVGQASSLPNSGASQDHIHQQNQQDQKQAGWKPAPLPFTPFDKIRPASITSRRLPHWQQEGATYFLTFRLADSLPQDVYEKWRRERDEALRKLEKRRDQSSKKSDQPAIMEHASEVGQAPVVGQASSLPDSADNREQLTDELREKLETELDHGYGECWLQKPEVSALVENALRHFDGERYLLGSYVVMPNHVHALVRPAVGHKLSEIVHSWKSFTANEANRFLGRSGSFWQDESFDHIVRDEHQLERFHRYISENPTKANLSENEFKLGIGLGGREVEETGRLEACPTTGGADFQPANINDPAVAAAIKVVMDRLKLELAVIEKTGFISYFLIVGDFIRYGRSKGIACVARGSAAGSLVTYLLEIANVDPIRYGLLFERFLNPERVNPPDIDIDFADDRRADVIEYVREKYGRDSVAQIITFGTMGAKSVVRDVGRVMGLNYSECDRLAKMIPNELKMSLEKALKQSPDFKTAYETEEVTRELIDTAFVLEDLTRNASVHAAGVVIGDQPLVNLLPLKQDDDGTIVTQYAMGPVGDLGLLKMDFLGLKTLTVIRNTCEMVKRTKGVDVPIDNLPLDDARAYDLLNKGNTLGIFQLESGGMRDLCRKFQISSVEHITALIALYRPGPMELIPEFIKRRHGEVKIEYEHPLLEPICRETYGIMVYQEQVMQAAQVLAGYTLGGADLLRRAMGKKKVEEMQQQRDTFVKGAAKANQISAAKANQIFDLLEKFAGYGFNKSHAAAYAIVAYQTAYLKGNYPVEFLCAMMTNDMSSTEKLAQYIHEARQLKIEVKPPDVNESFVAFAPAPGKVESVNELNVEKNAGAIMLGDLNTQLKTFSSPSSAIRFGLAAIKGVGEIAVESILQARRKDGKFTSLTDLCQRVDIRTVNRKVLEALIKSGACDAFGETRASLWAQIDRVLVRAANDAQDRQRGQASLFGMLQDAPAPKPEPSSQMAEWPQNELLAAEKELLGFYVTGHPLTPYATLLEQYSLATTTTLGELPNRSMTRIGGMVSAVQQGFSKKSGKPYALLTLEDLHGTVQVLCMNENYDRYRELMQLNQALLVIGEVNTGDDKPKIFPQEILLLDDAPRQFTKQVHLRLYLVHLTPQKLEAAKNLSAAHPGKCPLFLCFIRPAGEIVFLETNERFFVTPSRQLQQAVDELFGEDTYYAKVDSALPERAPRRWERKQENGAED